MPKIIDILLDEHQNIEKLLLVLEHELEVFDRSGRPDYEILQSIIQYFQDYPESCHHPKEEMIFEKLKLRDPAAAKRFGDVYASILDGISRPEMIHRVQIKVPNVLIAIGDGARQFDRLAPAIWRASTISRSPR